MDITFSFSTEFITVTLLIFFTVLTIMLGYRENNLLFLILSMVFLGFLLGYFIYFDFPKVFFAVIILFMIVLGVSIIKNIGGRY